MGVFLHTSCVSREFGLRLSERGLGGFCIRQVTGSIPPHLCMSCIPWPPLWNVFDEVVWESLTSGGRLAAYTLMLRAECFCGYPVLSTWREQGNFQESGKQKEEVAVQGWSDRAIQSTEQSSGENLIISSLQKKHGLEKQEGDGGRRRGCSAAISFQL